jgi:hypothetical protein
VTALRPRSPIGRADADDVERAQARRSAGAGVPEAFEQAHAATLVLSAFPFGVHVGLIVAPKRYFRKRKTALCAHMFKNDPLKYPRGT